MVKKEYKLVTRFKRNYCIGKKTILSIDPLRIADKMATLLTVVVLASIIFAITGRLSQELYPTLYSFVLTIVIVESIALRVYSGLLNDHINKPKEDDKK